MTFSNLGLSDKVLAAVSAAGYTTPTPIQEQAIPHVLARRVLAVRLGVDDQHAGSYPAVGIATA